jgi:hypothetical protein
MTQDSGLGGGVSQVRPSNLPPDLSKFWQRSEISTNISVPTEASIPAGLPISCAG